MSQLQSQGQVQFQHVAGTQRALLLFFLQGCRHVGKLTRTKEMWVRCRFPGPTPKAQGFLFRGNKSSTWRHLHSLFLPGLLFYKYSSIYEKLDKMLQATEEAPSVLFQRGCYHLFVFPGQVQGCAVDTHRPSHKGTWASVGLIAPRGLSAPLRTG